MSVKRNKFTAIAKNQLEPLSEIESDFVTKNDFAYLVHPANDLSMNSKQKKCNNLIPKFMEGSR